MALKASSISKRFKEKWALKDVSFSAERGSVTGIFGPPGSGKSVLLRLLAGAQRPDSGKIDLPGAIGGSANLIYPEKNDSPGILEALGLVKRNDRSTGERALEFIEGASRSTAELILLDESFCHLGLDRKTTAFETLREHAANDKYIIFASSNFEDILQFCDVVWVLKDGEMLQTGSPEKVYLEPGSSVVARLTGRINLFEARRLSSSKSESPEYQTIDGSHRLHAGKTGKAKLGPINQNSLLGIRPEHISISFGASFPEDNLLKAVIKGIRFLGAGTLVDLDAEGLALTAFVRRLVGLNLGDECMLGLPPDRIQVFQK